jgi:glutathione S-transferase
MAIHFYYGSGSPFAWNAWLVLEHKRLPYQLHVLSLQSGELKQPGYLAINPRGKVPALVDDGFALWETSAIVAYLDERYPEYPVFPSGIAERAVVRRLSAEVHTYLYPELRKLMELTLLRTGGDGDPAAIADALDGLREQLRYFENALQGDYLFGDLSAADFALYPLLALVQRLHVKRPGLGAGELIAPRLAGFMQRIEQLPYFAKTYPPHWQE